MELVRVPFKWYPGPRPLREALVWRLIDLEEAQGRPIDLVIATKFPSYAIRHPNKVVWLVHQFRQAYDLDRTELGQFGDDPFDRATVRAIQQARSRDARGGAPPLRDLGQRRRPASAIDRARSRGAAPTAAAAGLPLVGRRWDVHPLGRAARPLETRRSPPRGRGAGRDACRSSSPGTARIGSGSSSLPRSARLDGRVRFAGRVDEQELVDLYADCLAVYYAPIDEDLGLVPYEAFLSEKPVVTTRDAGGPLEVVVDGENGLVCEPDRRRRRRGASPGLRPTLTRLAAAGARASGPRNAFTWDVVVDRLLGT